MKFVLKSIFGGRLKSFAVFATLFATFSSVASGQQLPWGVVADSALEWQADGVQPDGNWLTGSYSAPTDPSTFEVLPTWGTYYAGPNSWIGGLGQIWRTAPYPRIGKYAMAPSSAAAAVRRWTSNFNGRVILHIDCQQLQDSLNNQDFRLYKNGILEAVLQKSEDSHHLVFMQPCQVQIGDQLDFVIDALGNNAADWTHVHIRVLSEDGIKGALFHFPFNERSDYPTGWAASGPLYNRRGRLADMSGHDHHAVLQNFDLAAPSQEGVNDQARFFDGSNDRIVLEQENLGDGLEELTMSVWVKPTTKGSNKGVITTTGNYFALSLSNRGEGNPIEFRANGVNLLAPDHSCPVDEWTQVTGVWKSGEWQRLYLNGELVSQQESPDSGPIDVGQWILGQDRAFPNRYFHGLMDEALVLDRALTNAEVRGLYRKNAALLGVTGPAVYFDGKDDCQLREETGVNAESATEVTLSAWISPFSKNDNAGIVTTPGQANDFFGLTLTSNGEGNPIEFRALRVPVVGPSFSCPPGQWNHVTGVWKSGEIQKLYLNGVEVASNANPPAGTFDMTDWLVGCDRFLAYRFYHGLIDNLQILPEALDAAAVDALYREHLTPEAEGPVRMEGFISYDVWTATNGLTIEDLKASPKYLNPAQVRQPLPSTEGYTQWGDQYGSRMRGYLTPSETGEHTFWVAAADDVEVWLSSDEDKFKKELILDPRVKGRPRDWDKDLAQRSKPIFLEAGKDYYLEVLHKAQFGGDHLSLAWTPPNGERDLIRGEFLTPYISQDNDLDDDDLDDNFENANGLSSSDNGSIDPNNGASGDLDGDGLSNLEEFLQGTLANNADSDGDGIDDATEVKLLETDALLNDVLPFLPHVQVDGSSFTNQFGDWIAEEGTARHTKVRGWLEYDINVRRKGVYLLEAELSHYVGGELNTEYEVVFTVDGVELERSYAHVPSEPGSRGNAQALTPWLHPGTHTVRVYLDNSLTYRKAKIHQIKLSLSQGNNQTWGRPGWVDERLRRLNGLDIDVNGPIDSLVSPACIEGRSRHLALTTATSEGENLTLQSAPGDRWYVNVPLKTNPYARKTINFEFESNAFRDKHVARWKMTNLLVVTPPILRVGDSLQLTAWSTAYNQQRPRNNEDVTLTLEGQTYSFKADQPLIYQFNTPGTHLIDVTHLRKGVTTTAQVTVKVVAPVDLTSPVCVLEQYREWNLPILDADIKVELDHRVEVRESATRADGGKTHVIRLNQPQDRQALLRLGEGGPILSTVALRSMRFRDSTNTSVEFIESYPDGTNKVEMPVMVDGLYPEVEFRYVIFLSGVLFEDGSLDIELLPEDYDDYGVNKIRFLKTGTVGSVCYLVYIFQDGERIAFISY